MNFSELICLALTVYLVLLFARALLSWFPVAPDSPFARISRTLSAITDPVLKPFRGLIPPVRTGGMALDLSFLLVVFILFFIRAAICSAA